MAKEIQLSKLVVIVGVVSGLCIILLIGLLCGLVARPNNCISTTKKPTTTLSTLTTTTADPPYSDIRLPKNVKPSNYDLTLKTYFEPYSSNGDIDISKEWFEGIVEIDIELINQTRSIILHSDNSLNITSVKLENQSGISIPIKSRDPLPYQLISINTETVLNIGSYTLKIEYKGNYGPISNLYGFYRTRYQEDGKIKTVLGSKFEPVDARKAFPCFDEPDLKATYDITIEHPKNSIALSNWPVKNSTESGLRITTKFERTYRMSTYLIAWVVAPDDFEFETSKTKKGQEIRIYARKSAVRNGLVKFAAEVASSVTDFFENVYFEISEAVPPKIDLVALPDFSAGAMEHWGLIGFRETYLLYSEKINSFYDKQTVASVIAHELAHFWFGNLVTCAWWNDLWLNEAMASFLEAKALQKVYPEFDIMDQQISDVLVPVMYDDGYPSSQPVSVDVLNPDEISSLFSSITYDKGSSCLYMLESTVGEINFRDGLRNYLKTNKYQTGVAADFYKTLILPSEMAGVTTAQEYIETWLLQINYPEVDVIVENKDGQNTAVKFVQDRYLLSIYDEDLEGIPSPYNYTWKIYLQCKAGKLNSNSFSDFNYYLDKKTGNMILDNKYDWFKCNKDFKGFYVTDYDEKNFLNLINILEKHPEVFSIGDRANLIHGAYSLSFKGSNSYSKPAYLANYIENNEEDFVPWKVLIWHMNKLSQVLEHRTVFNQLRRYGISLAKRLSEKLNIWSDTGRHTERLLKSALIDFLCRLQDPECTRKTTQFFNTIPVEYFNSPVDFIDNNTIVPNFRSAVYRYHMQNTDQFMDWFNLNELYLRTIDPQERASVIIALSYSRLLWILDLYLDELLKETSRIRPQDFFDVISSIGRNPSGRPVAWNFIRHKWAELVKKFGNSKALNRAIKNVVESFDNTFLLEEVLDFFEITDNGSGVTLRAQAVEIILNNIFWVIDRENDLLNAFFTPN